MRREGASGFIVFDGVGVLLLDHVDVPARHMGVQCVGISHITNLAAGLGDSAITHSDVLKEGAKSAGRLGALVRTFLEDLNTGRDEPLEG